MLHPRYPVVGEFLQHDVGHLSPRITVEYRPGKQLVLLHVMEEEKEKESGDSTKWVVREKVRLHPLTSREEILNCLQEHGFVFAPVEDTNGKDTVIDEDEEGHLVSSQ